MTTNGNHMPKPEAIWVALGIVAWAVAEALSDGRRSRFIEALSRLAGAHKGPRQIASFVRPASATRDVSQAARIAGVWLSRIVAELRAAQR